MSYTPKQPGSGAGGSGAGQNTQQKTLAQQMQDAVHSANALTQAISTSQAFSNLNMSRQQQQQQQQRLDLLMKQQQYIFSNPQIQQLQQQIQQHIQNQQQNANEPLALTRGPNQQQQANGSAGASVLANQQLQLQQAYANPANLMQQFQAYQFQMQQQQQQQQQQKMMPINQAQSPLSSASFQAQNAAAAQHFQQQQKLLAAAAAVAQTKSLAAINQKGSSQSSPNQSNVSPQTPSNNNLPNKSPARSTGLPPNFSKIPATIQPSSVKPTQTVPSHMLKQAAPTGPSASKVNVPNVSGNVTITKSSPTPTKPPQPNPAPFTKSLTNVSSSLTITKTLVTSSSSPSTSPGKALPVNSTQSQSPKPAMTATTAAISTPAVPTPATPKPSPSKETTAKLDPKPEVFPSVAKAAPSPQSATATPDSNSGLPPSPSPQNANQQKEETTLSMPQAATIPSTVPTTTSEKVPEESLPIVTDKKPAVDAPLEEKKSTPTDSKVMENEKVSNESESTDRAADKEQEEPPSVPEDKAPKELDQTTPTSKVAIKEKPPVAQKKSTSPIKSELSSSSNDVTKSSEKKKPCTLPAPSNEHEMQSEAPQLPPAIQQSPPVASTPTTSVSKEDSLDTPKSNSDRRSRRHRLKTIPFQSPLPELAYITKLSVAESSASSSPKASEDKLTLFYKNEYLAVRNAEGSFFLCQTLQNVFKTSPKIRIRWLSEEKSDEGVYIPDFYDTTDIECVLTTVEMEKVNKDRWRLPKVEKARVENILRKAIDVEQGIAPRPVVTEENPDGLDISLYKNESQIEKRKDAKKENDEQKPVRTLTKRAGMTPSKSKSPKKKRKTKKSTKGVNSSDVTESNESDEETDNDKEYKPKKINLVTQPKVSRAQRSPLARARAASPIIIKKDSMLKSKSTTVPSKNSLVKRESTLGSTPSRSDRAKRRGAMEDVLEESPAKKVHMTARRVSSKSSAVEQAAKSSDDELLIPLPDKMAGGKSTTKTSNSNATGSVRSTQKPLSGSTASSSPSGSDNNSTSARFGGGRATRSRK